MCNWETQEIKFWQQGGQIKLKGINSPLLNHSSLKNYLEPHLISLSVDTKEPTTLTVSQ